MTQATLSTSAEPVSVPGTKPLPRPRARPPLSNATRVQAVLLLAAILGLWEAGVRLSGVSRQLLPPVSDIAVAAMLLPLGVGLLNDAGLRPGESNVGRSLMIATAFGPLIGGIATPAGTAANLVAISQLKQLASVDVSFWRWMTLECRRRWS